MKTISALLIMIFIISLGSNAQFSVKILDENFDNNLNGWAIGKNENSEMTIQNGNYLMTGLKDSTAIISTIEAANIQNNFAITASLTKIKGINDNGYGLVWGSLNENNELEFVISGNGHFKVAKWENGIKKDIFPWTYSMAINKWADKNVLTIVNLNNVVQFYINEHYVLAIDDFKTIGNKIGFVADEKMMIVADYIIVQNLSIKENNCFNYAIDAKIINLNYKTSGAQNNILYYGRKGMIRVQIKNTGNTTLRNLVLRTEIGKNPNNEIEYNPITMIDKIDPYEIKTYNIEIYANNYLSYNLPRSVNLKLFNLYHDLLDEEKILITAIGKDIYNWNWENVQEIYESEYESLYSNMPPWAPNNPLYPWNDIINQNSKPDPPTSDAEPGNPRGEEIIKTENEGQK